MKINQCKQSAVALAVTTMLLSGLLSGCGGSGNQNPPPSPNPPPPPPPPPPAVTLATPSRSSSIALTSDDRYLVVANRNSNSVSIVEVRDSAGQDVAFKRAEIPVGVEPRYVAISPDNAEAYVANAVSGTVSVVSLSTQKVVGEIAVGVEPRGIALTPNGTRLYVAHNTAGTVTEINPVTRQVTGTITVGGRPQALAITNDGDADDQDETVFVTQFYSEPIPGGPGEASDTGRQGVVQSFAVASPTQIIKTTLAPLVNAGFTADRTEFCQNTRTATTPLHSALFCPDVAATGGDVITKDPQGAFPNQLFSALIRGSKLYLPSIGAAPEPPTRFNVNVQALVSVVDTAAKTEVAGLSPFNLNNQIKLETQPAAGTETTVLTRVFGNDIVAIDANRAGTDFLIVSRGGNYLLRATADATGFLNIAAPDSVKRYQTGHIPSGVVISGDGRRAYSNNEVGVSVTAVALDTNTVLTRDIAVGEVPAPGTIEHQIAVGKLGFFTALGIPDNGFKATPIRDIDPLQFRNHASDNGWSGCGSCHNDGLSDQVTWIFAAGPRNTIPLDAFFAKNNPDDQRIANWSAIRGSVTDFNINSRVEQGGKGFAGGEVLPANGPGGSPDIFNHGATQGVSEALDAITAWVQVVRPYRMPAPTDFAVAETGRTLFAGNCASCHGGDKWTKSQVIYANNPSFTKAPVPGDKAIDPRITNIAAHIQKMVNPLIDPTGVLPGSTLTFLNPIGTFGGAADPLEINSAGGDALGAAGFNAPALLSAGFHAPYLHNGTALTLDDVFARHVLGLAPATIGSSFSDADRAALAAFVNSIDATSAPLASETDSFKAALSN